MSIERVHQDLLATLHPAKVHMVTGRNGTGKSRFFRYATQRLYEELLGGAARFSKLICLAGTLHDKYPKEIIDANKSVEYSVYLGYKVNHNMFSEMTPFRTMINFIFDPEYATSDASSVACDLLKSIRIADDVEFKFRFARGAAKELTGSLSQTLRINLRELSQQIETYSDFFITLKAGKLILADVSFFRDDKPFGVGELSSGERLYIQSVLGSAFCGRANSVFFFDEPENSLHPEWHLKMARDISDLIERLHPGSAMVIATHSPLVASSIPNERLLLCDFPREQKWTESTLHGKTNDAILSEHFHLFSPRSKEVAVLIQACLSEIAQGRRAGELFRQSADRLRAMDLSIERNDPLFDVVKNITDLQ